MSGCVVKNIPFNEDKGQRKHSFPLNWKRHPIFSCRFRCEQQGRGQTGLSTRCQSLERRTLMASKVVGLGEDLEMFTTSLEKCTAVALAAG